jgi:hypothetical protein
VALAAAGLNAWIQVAQEEMKKFLMFINWGQPPRSVALGTYQRWVMPALRSISAQEGERGTRLAWKLLWKHTTLENL